MPPSYDGKNVKIWYIVKVIFRHDAWSEEKDGKFIEFPIHINKFGKAASIQANE